MKTLLYLRSGGANSYMELIISTSSEFWIPTAELGHNLESKLGYLSESLSKYLQPEFSPSLKQFCLEKLFGRREMSCLYSSTGL